MQRHFGHDRKDKLNTIFNKHTVKLSYSCTKNLGAIISAHNTKVLQDSNKKPQQNVKECNCLPSRKENCPLNGKCQHHDKGVVYRATATTQEGVVKTYTGSTDNFKNRWYAHVGDTQDRDRRTATALAGFFWEKKDEGVDTEVRWEILR